MGDEPEPRHRTVSAPARAVLHAEAVLPPGQLGLDARVSVHHLLPSLFIDTGTTAPFDSGGPPCFLHYADRPVTPPQHGQTGK